MNLRLGYFGPRSSIPTIRCSRPIRSLTLTTSLLFSRSCGGLIVRLGLFCLPYPADNKSSKTNLAARGTEGHTSGRAANKVPSPDVSERRAQNQYSWSNSPQHRGVRHIPTMPQPPEYELYRSARPVPAAQYLQREPYHGLPTPCHRP